MYTANSSISTAQKKLVVDVSELRYSKQIEFQEELINFLRTWLKYKTVSWKYNILPTLFWAALILLRSKQRK